MFRLIDTCIYAIDLFAILQQLRVACRNYNISLYCKQYNFRRKFTWKHRIFLKNLREKNHLTQEEMATRIHVTRQAVSRWETGDTLPNTETLKLLSREFNVSINTLLGSPRQLICQCCGMPLNEDDLISRESDGNYNEDYCKWCYADGKFAYESKESLLDY